MRTQFADPAPGNRAALYAKAQQRSSAANTGGPVKIKRRIVKKAFYSDEEGASGARRVMGLGHAWVVRTVAGTYAQQMASQCALLGKSGVRPPPFISGSHESCLLCVVNFKPDPNPSHNSNRHPTRITSFDPDVSEEEEVEVMPDVPEQPTSALFSRNADTELEAVEVGGPSSLACSFLGGWCRGLPHG